MKTKEEIEKEAQWRFTDGHGSVDDYCVKIFIDACNWMNESTLKFDDADRAKYYEDKIEMLQRILSQFQQEWIPVEVRLPELEEDVLLLDCWKTTDGQEDRVDIRIGFLQSFTTTKTSTGLHYSCEWDGTQYAFNITHWRPLPPLPQPYNPKQS